MNQASRGKPFSTTLTRRNFSAAVLQRRRRSAFQLLGNRPLNVFIEKRVLAPAALQGAKMGFIPGRIAQRDGDIAQPAQVANATNRRPFGHLQKPRFARANSSTSGGACSALRGLKSSSSVSCEKRFHGQIS